MDIALKNRVVIYTNDYQNIFIKSIYLMEAGGAGARQWTSTQNSLSLQKPDKSIVGEIETAGDLSLLSLNQQPQVLCCFDVCPPFSAM